MLKGRGAQKEIFFFLYVSDTHKKIEIKVRLDKPYARTPDKLRMEERRTFYTIFRKEHERRTRINRDLPRLWITHHVITTQDPNELRPIIGDEMTASLQLKLLFDCPSSVAMNEDFEYNKNIYMAVKSCVPPTQMYIYYHMLNGVDREDVDLRRSCMSWKEVKEEFGEYAEGHRRRVQEGIYEDYVAVKEALRGPYSHKRVQIMLGGEYADVTFYKVPLYTLHLT